MKETGPRDRYVPCLSPASSLTRCGFLPGSFRCAARPLDSGPVRCACGSRLAHRRLLVEWGRPHWIRLWAIDAHAESAASTVRGCEVRQRHIRELSRRQRAAVGPEGARGRKRDLRSRNDRRIVISILSEPSVVDRYSAVVSRTEQQPDDVFRPSWTRKQATGPPRSEVSYRRPSPTMSVITARCAVSSTTIYESLDAEAR